MTTTTIPILTTIATDALANVGTIGSLKDLEAALSFGLRAVRTGVNQLPFETAQELAIVVVGKIFDPALIFKGAENAKDVDSRTSGPRNPSRWLVSSVPYDARVTSVVNGLIDLDVDGTALIEELPDGAPRVFGRAALTEAGVALFYDFFTGEFFHTLLALDGWREVVRRSLAKANLTPQQAADLARLLR